jgi:hypothetical protein
LIEELEKGRENQKRRRKVKVKEREKTTWPIQPQQNHMALFVYFVLFKYDTTEIISNQKEKKVGWLSYHSCHEKKKKNK